MFFLGCRQLLVELEHGKPGNSARLFYYGFVLLAQLCPRPRAVFLICLIRIREDLLKGAEQSCEGQADSSAPSVLAHAGISQAQLSNFENGKVDLDAKMLKAVEKAIMEVGRRRTTEGFRILSDAVA